MKNYTSIEKPNNEDKFYIDNNLSGIKIRRIQAIHSQRSLLLGIPIEFIEGLDIIKVDYAKYNLKSR